MPYRALHGELPSGKVLWPGRECVLIDPSPHCGHCESDFAMLAPCGLPHLDDVLEVYHHEWPLDPNFEARRDLRL